MTEVDDKTLTAFLIACFIKIFNGELQPTDQEHRPKNLRQYKHQDGDLTFLGTDAGLLDSIQSDIRVMQGPSGDRFQIWGMSIVTRIRIENLKRLGIPRSSLRLFSKNARQNGFKLTKAKIKRGEPFSLFDLPDYDEEATVGRDVPSGKFRYHERISNDLAFFGGEDVIKYLPNNGGAPVALLESYYQGGRV